MNLQLDKDNENAEQLLAIAAKENVLELDEQNYTDEKKVFFESCKGSLLKEYHSLNLTRPCKSLK